LGTQNAESVGGVENAGVSIKGKERESEATKAQEFHNASFVMWRVIAT
jgi:predicted secreted protein